MAVATDTDTLTDSPASISPPAPGLAARLSCVSDGLATLVADLRPELLVGSDAASLFEGFARLSRLADAGKTVLAPRIAESKHWANEGHRSPEDLLARLEGGSHGQAKRTLETGRQMHELPGLEQALRKGTLSGAKATEIAQAATLDPTSEASLLEGAEDASLREVKERAQQVRATAANGNPLDALRRIHAKRSFSSWTDSEGAFCFNGRDTADRGAKLLAALNPVVDRLREDARTAAAEAVAGSPSGAPAPTPASEAAFRADALFLLVCSQRAALAGFPGPTAPDTSESTTGDGTTGDGTTGDADDSTTRCDRIPSTPAATVMVRVDLDALRRGTTLPGETCALDGQGPIPVPTARNLLDDAFLAYVFMQAGDIKAVSHHGRTINRRLRTALILRDRCCVVPHCGVAYGLEIDHVIPMEEGGPTELDNLALLCHHHHWQKTYEGWTLERTGPSDEDPKWTFTPQPPFGQEPGLGADRPPEPVPRR